MCLFYNQLLLILVLISRIVRIDMKTLLLAPFARLKKKILWGFFLGGGWVFVRIDTNTQPHSLPYTLTATTASS